MTEAGGTAPAAVASRPRLRPAARWARVALILLVVFALLRGAVWAMTFPSFYGPDEDYHFLYIEYLTTQHALPSPSKPLYPDEYGAMVNAEHYDAYGGGPRTDFTGDPHASTRATGRLPKGFRDPKLFGRGVGVVHPPLYHAIGALVNAALDGAPAFTRYDAIRWYSSAIGALAVYAAWLLAAQVFRHEAMQLLAALLVAVQPMIGVLSGIANHDIMLVATFTLASAFLAFLLRSPPRARQGAWLGGAITLALLVKGSAMVLLPLAALVYLAQGWVYGRWREVLRSAALAFGIVALLAGWWYVRSEALYGSLAGYTPSPVAGSTPYPATFSRITHLIGDWISLTYRTYWWHHFWYEAPRTYWWFHVPEWIGGAAAVGLAAFVARSRRLLRSVDRPELRQAILFALCALALWLPLMGTDIGNYLNHKGFSLSGGRYLLPAYAGVVCLALLGFRAIVPRRIQVPAFAALALFMSWFCAHTWSFNYLHRYYGKYGTSWHALLQHMSFDRPEFVTPTTLTIAMVCIAAAYAGFALALLAGWLPGWRRAAPAAS